MTGTSDTIDAVIRGNVSGQIAVGKDIYQVQTLQLTNHGGVVNLGPAAQAPRPQPRASPAPFRFRPFPDLLDRDSELHSALAALGEPAPVELTGEPGIGKTALLRHLAHAPGLPVFADGVICLGQSLVAGRSVDDVLQTLFDAYYESPNPYKPSAAELRLALQEKRALVMVDDWDLERDEVSAFLDAAPGCAVALAGPTPRLWGEGRSIVIHGLLIEAAVSLLERGLGRSLRDDERPAARDLCQALAGHPLRILQAAALMRDEQTSAAVMLQRLQAGQPASPTALALAALPSGERRVLGALSAPAGIRLNADMIGPLSGMDLPHAALDGLVTRGLVEADAGGYRLAAGFSESELAALSPGAQPRETLNQITRWVKLATHTAAEIQAHGDAILHILAWAASAGMWSTGLELARASEASFTLSGAWGAWSRILEFELQAARALGDSAAEAWALHQLGTRALCLNDLSTAYSSLHSALQLREALGDDAGAAVTRHNLALTLPAPAAQAPSPSEHRTNGRPLKLIGALAAIVGLGALALWRLAAPPEPPPPTPLATPSAAPLAASSTPLPLVVGPTSTQPIGSSTDTPTAVTSATATPSATLPPTVTPSPTREPTRPTPSPSSVPLADLVVEGLELTGRPASGIAPGFTQRSVSFLVPVRVTVRNQGSLAAPVFKVSALFTGQVGTVGRGTYEAPFVVPGQNTPQYAFSAAPLVAGGVVPFGGTIVLPLSLAGQSVALSVTADSCASEEFQPPYCRVQELEEANNTSAPLQVQLPTIPTPTPARVPPTPTRTPTRVVIN